jgi:hypothetical protein
MRHILFCIGCLVLTSCHNFNKTVKGNGDITKESREIGNITKIKIEGGIDVELRQGSPSVKVEADDNLQSYVITREEHGWLVIKTKDHVNLKSDHTVKVYVSADMISAIRIAGSSNLVATGKFSGAEKMDIDVAGSGEVAIEVNTPKVMVNIAGSGKVTLTGDTRDADVDIAGSATYDAMNLLTENTNISMAGSGDATVFADISLKADLVGSGNVSYRGKATVKTSSIGSGRVTRIP